jgi:hypothetical protein
MPWSWAAGTKCVPIRPLVVAPQIANPAISAQKVRVWEESRSAVTALLAAPCCTVAGIWSGSCATSLWTSLSGCSAPYAATPRSDGSSRNRSSTRGTTARAAAAITMEATRQPAASAATATNGRKISCPVALTKRHGCRSISRLGSPPAGRSRADSVADVWRRDRAPTSEHGIRDEPPAVGGELRSRSRGRLRHPRTCRFTPLQAVAVAAAAFRAHRRLTDAPHQPAPRSSSRTRRPIIVVFVLVREPASGFEPETARLQVGCAASCAMPAKQAPD